jgi:hypothetical protein
VRRSLALLRHLALLLTAFRWTHSASGFLLHGPTLALLLDRYALRLLPWVRLVAWRRELLARTASFLGSAAVFYLLRPGIVPW